MLQRTIRNLTAIFTIFICAVSALVIYTYLSGKGDRRLLLIDCLVAFALFILFGYLEQELPKHEVEKAVRNGQVMLAEIKAPVDFSKMHVKSYRDHDYVSFRVSVINHDGSRNDAILSEEFQKGSSGAPCGMVFVAYQRDHPDEISLIPTELIMRTPGLERMIRAYESDSALDIRYLNVVYDRGYRIEKMSEMIRKASDRIGG